MPAGGQFAPTPRPVAGIALHGQGIDDLLELRLNLKLPDDALDEDVHDLHSEAASQAANDGADHAEAHDEASRAASSVNNDGPPAQIAYLVQELGASGTADRLRDLARSVDDPSARPDAGWHPYGVDGAEMGHVGGIAVQVMPDALGDGRSGAAYIVQRGELTLDEGWADTTARARAAAVHGARRVPQRPDDLPDRIADCTPQQREQLVAFLATHPATQLRQQIVVLDHSIARDDAASRPHLRRGAAPLPRAADDLRARRTLIAEAMERQRTRTPHTYPA